MSPCPALKRPGVNSSQRCHLLSHAWGWQGPPQLFPGWGHRGPRPSHQSPQGHCGHRPSPHTPGTLLGGTRGSGLSPPRERRPLGQSQDGWTHTPRHGRRGTKGTFPTPNQSKRGNFRGWQGHTASAAPALSPPAETVTPRPAGPRAALKIPVLTATAGDRGRVPGDPQGDRGHWSSVATVPPASPLPPILFLSLPTLRVGDPHPQRPTVPFSPTPRHSEVAAVPHAQPYPAAASVEPGPGGGCPLLLSPRPSPKPLIHLSQREMPKLPFHGGSSARGLAAPSMPAAGGRCVGQAGGIPPPPARSRWA